MTSVFSKHLEVGRDHVKIYFLYFKHKESCQQIDFQAMEEIFL